ncbi:ferrous iron transport protein B [Geothrix sp. PMB-07]|uniref:ferrous iron transport protein B n=1 Tax=Geothrix sp. PMB-07 TaxID=3068640 RepID=UPI0027415893|nr:ferrous iron transport protein B [Geothrix sp. PMB-07]WLT32684.1 ferrous iron transport protein B [Geothrix sp. PMB-07]
MTLTIALAGNPNCGKTTLFNALTGARHHVGNWPGVTVERRSGTFEDGGTTMEVVDLPGTYSLSARSEDEKVASQFLASPEVDLVLNVLDASNLERNLYLSTQLLELGKPVAFVLNMVDDAENRGVRIDVPALEQLLGGPVIPTVGNREQGITELKTLLSAMARGESNRCRRITVDYGHDIEGELTKLQTEICRDELLEAAMPPRWLALQLLENNAEAKRVVAESHAAEAIKQQLAKSFAFLEPHLGADGATLVAERRYGFAHGLVKEVATAPDDKQSPTSKLDAVLTHRVIGIPIFLGVLALMYSLSFILGKIPQDWIADGFKALSGFAASRLPAGELTSLLVDGIIPGLSAVIVFVPVIMILMGCIAFLEDTGYMARAAFIMDRLMHVMGLHGKSFIPLIMGSGCNVPAIQAARTIESPQDRLITMLVTPLVSCSARLQVYIVIAGTFFTPFKAALAIIAMHFLGLALAVLMGRLLRSALFSGPSSPFVMELPPYRLPTLKATLIHMWEKGSIFLTRAGTTIFAGATLVWFLSRYPGIANREWTAEYQQQRQAVVALNLPKAEAEEKLKDLQLAHESRIVNTSLAARLGQKVEPVLRPILDPDHKRAEAWKDVIALTAGFVAKEIVVSTMAVIHQASEEPKEGERLSPLQVALRDGSGLTPLTALAFMVFTLIYTPCLGTIAMIRREAGSWGWAAFTVGYGLALGWGLAWITVAAGRALGFA